MYSSTLSLTSALNGVRGQYHAPAILPPGKSRYPLYRRLGGPQGWFGRVRKTLPPAEIRSPNRPVRSPSLYQLSYPVAACVVNLNIYFDIVCLALCRRAAQLGFSLRSLTTKDLYFKPQFVRHSTCVLQKCS